jgi:hypothetical protein
MADRVDWQAGLNVKRCSADLRVVVAISVAGNVKTAQKMPGKYE